MAKTGTFYFLENFGYIPIENCLLYFNLKKNSGYPIYSIGYTGNGENFSLDVLSGSTSNAGLLSHNGYFDSTRILGVKTNTGNGWTSGFKTASDYNEAFGFVFIASGAKGVIFSNLEVEQLGGSNLYKGFSFGINDANKLYFENRDDAGVNSYCLNSQLGENNCLMVSYSNGSLSLGQYDYFSSSATVENYFFNKPFIPTSKNWKIGTINENFSDLFYNKPYKSGYIESFLFLNRAVDETNFKYISSGFICEPFLTGEFSGLAPSIEITGYTTGLVPVSSGITGYNIVATGEITDIFGNIFTGYSQEPVYYVESGLDLIALTGEVLYPVFSGERRIELDFDTGFAGTFGMTKGISAYPLDQNTDVFSWNFEKNFGNDMRENQIIKDKVLNYDRINKGFFVGQNKDFLLYFNGIFQNSGSYSLTGDFYSPYITQDRDYYISGGFVFSNDSYNKDDNISVDFLNYKSISIFENFKHLSGTGHRFISTGINNVVFFNGQKLHTGNSSDLLLEQNQIKVSGDSMFFSNCCDLFDGERGVLTIIKDISGGFHEINSSSGFFARNEGRFKQNSLVCYFNGMKLEKDKDFFEGSSKDLFHNFGNLNELKGVLYNNNSNFFEN